MKYKEKYFMIQWNVASVVWLAFQQYICICNNWTPRQMSTKMERTHLEKYLLQNWGTLLHSLLSEFKYEHNHILNLK